MSSSPLRYGDRQRLFAWTLLFLLLSGAVAVFVVHQVMLLTLEQRVQEQLQNGATAFQEIVAGTGADNTEELGEALARFRSRATPTPQTGFVFADGERVPAGGDDPFAVPDGEQERWAEIDNPAQGAVTAAAGRVDYLALPIQEAGSSSADGVFVVAVLTGPERDALRQTVSMVAVALLVVFAAASVVLWWVLHRGLGRAAAPATSAEQRTTGGDGLPGGATSADASAGDPAAAPPASVPAPPAAVEPADAPRVRRQGTGVRVGDRGAGATATTMAGPDVDRRVIDVTDDAAPPAPVRRRGAPRTPVLAGDRVELGRLVVDVYGRAQRLADRDWIMDIPPDAVVRCDYGSLVEALIAVAADTAARTHAGDLIHFGTTVTGQQAEVSVTAQPTDPATGTLRPPFEGASERLEELREALAAQGGDVVVDDPASVRLRLTTA